MYTDINTIKKALTGGGFNTVCLVNSDGGKLVKWNRTAAAYKDTANDILHKLESDTLAPGIYSVKFKATYTGDKGADAQVFKFNVTGTNTVNDSQEIKTTLQEMDKDTEILLRVELDRLKFENEQLRKEIEETDLEEEPTNAVTLAETIKTVLSEVVVPIVSKFMEQRERKIIALEAAAKTQVIAPQAPVYQYRAVTPNPVNRPTPTTPPVTAPAAGSAYPAGGGGGGYTAPSPTQQPETKIPEGITEEEYMEAVKHLEYNELVDYYESIKNQGTKLDMQFFLAIVKETRPDDLIKLIENDMKGSQE